MFIVGNGADCAYPVDVFAARVGGVHDALGVVPPAQPRDFVSAQLVGRDGGDVYVPQNRRARWVLHEAGNDVPHGFFGGGGIFVKFVAGEREGNGGDAHQIGFGGGGNSA